MLTRGKLVPRQPRAIKRTTPTALQNEGIYIAKYFHWNTGAIYTTLHGYNIPIGGYIQWNTTVKPTALRACYIRNILHIHYRFDHGTNIFGVHFTRYLCEFTAFLARH